MGKRDGTGRWACLAPPRRAALLYALALVGPLALLVVGCKLHKLLTLAEGIGPLGVLAGVAADVGVLGALGLVVAWSLSTLQGRWLPVLRALWHLVVLLLSLLALVEHGFYVTTGTVLDGYTLAYGLANLGPLKDVFASEMGAGTYVGAAGLVAVNLLPLWVIRTQRYRTALTQRYPVGAWLRRPIVTYAFGAVLFAGVASLTVPQIAVPNTAEPLRPSALATLLGEMFVSPEPAPLVVATQAQLDTYDLVMEPATPPMADAASPNVIVIVLESVRAHATTPYNPELDTTPQIATLAARGARAETAYTTLPHTSKSLVGILCGIQPKMDTPIEEAGPEGLPSKCLATLLAERGYQTVFFQAATQRFERRDQLVKNMGFAEFFPHEKLPTEGFDESNYFGFEDDIMVAPSLAWIDQQKGKPFFMGILTLAPHHKYGVPKGFKTKEYSKNVAYNKYLNTVRYLDRFIGKVVAGLKTRGLLDNTIMVLVGDHGEAFGEHGRRQHDVVIYEEGLRVPLIVLGPGIEPGTTIGGLRQTTDIVPTVLDLLGTRVVRGLPGKTLRDPEGHATIYASCWYRDRCMMRRDGDDKVIYHFGKRPAERFDLGADPKERENLLTGERKDDPEVLAAIEAMKAWRADANARYAAQFARFKDDYIRSYPPRPTIEMDVRFGDLVRLYGVDVEPTSVAHGDPVFITFYWEVLKPLGEDWRVFTHVLGASEGAKPATNADHTPVNGRYPYDEWEAGRFVVDRYRFQPRKKTPPGQYEIAVGVWNRTIKNKLDARAQPTGTGARLDDQRRARVVTFEVLPPK